MLKFVGNINSVLRLCLYSLKDETSKAFDMVTNFSLNKKNHFMIIGNALYSILCNLNLI